MPKIKQPEVQKTGCLLKSLDVNCFTEDGKPAIIAAKGRQYWWEGDAPMLFTSAGRTKAFISYCHADKTYLDRLHIHLAPYIRNNQLEIWDDTKIIPGSNWREEIKQAIVATKVAVLLISADFLASDYIAEHELPGLLAAAKHDGAIILCIILSPSAFMSTDLKQFHPINAPDRPLSRMAKPQQEEVWKQVAELVNNALYPERAATSQRPLGPIASNTLQSGEGAFSISTSSSMVNKSATKVGEAFARMRRLIYVEKPATNGQLFWMCQELSRSEKQVKELKEIHHLLHRLETDLAIVEMPIRLAEARKKRLDISLIEEGWKRGAKLRVLEMERFAAQDMKTLAPKFIIDENGEVTGPPWVAHLHLLKEQFEESLQERNSDEISQISRAMLDSCREHLFRIDMQLLGAVERLDQLTDQVLRSIGDDATVS